MTYANLMNNYFNPNSVYIEDDFRRRFWMRCHVFERLLHECQAGQSIHFNISWIEQAALVSHLIRRLMLHYE